MSKKIMIISSSLDGRLITAVDTARELGFQTVACVRREDDVTITRADRCYAVNGDETDRLLEIAKKEEIDGVLGVWDRSALSAAIIARELGLPGNSPECIKSLLEKGRFRKLQKETGVFCPGYFETDTSRGIAKKCAGLHFPIIMKPVLCSSSFGQTVLYDDKDIVSAFEKAAAYSRNGAVCVEEYIEQDSLRILETDIFLVGDDILWDGNCWCYRLPEAPLRPALVVYPVSLESSQEMEFQSAIRKMLKASGARIGEFNIEGFFTKEGRFFIIEINPRPAGYYCQQDIQLFCGVDYTKLLVTTALGDLSYYEELKSFRRQRNHILSYAVFSFRSGIFDHVYIDPSIRDSLLTFRAFPGGEPGAYIEDIHADNRPVGIAVFGFDSEEELNRAQLNIRDLVYVVLKDTEVTRQLRADHMGQKPMTLWFTGLSGSGKSTIANALEKKLYARGYYTMLLDGDKIRMGLNKNLGFEPEDRMENIRRVAEVARLMNDAGLVVLVSFISPYRLDRAKARKLIGRDHFVEIYVDTPLLECERRDVKGLYRKAREGKIPNFTGISSPYEAPEDPELIIHTEGTTPEECAEQIMDFIVRNYS